MSVEVSTNQPTRPGPTPAVPLRPGATLAIVCAAMFMLMLDMTITIAAMASIKTELNASLSDLQWVIDAYTLPVAGLLLTAATLGDRLGRRRLYLIGMAVFTLASAGCAMAGDALTLTIVRAVQGIGAVLLFGVGLPLIANAYPDLKKRAGAIGVFGAVLAAATAIGPLVGGALVDGPGWRWIFLINVPVGAAALLAAWRLLPESRSPIARKADWPGTVLLSGGLVAGVLALIQGNDLGWTSATVLGLAAATVLLLTAFLIRESRTPEPMLELELLRRPSFAAIAVVAFGITASLVAATTYMALYLINTLGLTPFQTGLVFLPLTGASFVAAPIAARLSTRIAPAILVPSGAALIAIGMWAMTGLDVTSDWTHLLPGSIIAGVGLGVTSAVLAQAALAAVPPSRAGMATGTANTFRQIGVAAGVAGLGALFAHRAAAVVTTGLTVAGVPPQPTAELADAVASGAGVQVVQGVPAQVQLLVADTAHLASASALNLVLITGTVIAAASAVIAVALLLVRPRTAVLADPLGS